MYCLMNLQSKLLLFELLFAARFGSIIMSFQFGLICCLQPILIDAVIDFMLNFKLNNETKLIYQVFGVKAFSI